MIDERERRILAELERRLSADDPRLARLLRTGSAHHVTWRSLGRMYATVPTLMVLAGLCIACLVVNLALVGVLLFLAAIAGLALRLHLDTSRHTPPASHRVGPRSGSQ